MAFASLLLLSTPGYAITIHYQATDLPDTVSGIDEWRYEYTVSEHNFAADTGFVIFFDPLLYTDLQDPAPLVNGDWDVLVGQPLPVLLDEGFYDALAIVNHPSVLEKFTIDFVWLGTTIPSIQPYEVYNADFTVFESGSTSSGRSNVPVLSGLLLFSSGLFTLQALRRKSNSIRFVRHHALKGKQL